MVLGIGVQGLVVEKRQTAAGYGLTGCVDTVALGVEEAPYPSRISFARNVETPSRSGPLVR